jgi:hypothetical protein
VGVRLVSCTFVLSRYRLRGPLVLKLVSRHPEVDTRFERSATIRVQSTIRDPHWHLVVNVSEANI